MLINGETEQNANTEIQITPPGDEESVYDVAPSTGTHKTLANASPATALTPDGADGTIAEAITEALAIDAAELPALFVAFTVNVYEVPLFNEDITQRSDDVEQVRPPGLEVTV